MKKSLYVLPFLLFMLSISVGAQTNDQNSIQEAQDLEQEDLTTEDSKKEPRGPFDDCLQSSFLYSEFDGIESECTLNYVHFRNTKNIRLSKKPDGQIKIGSFNVYHLGDEQAIMKNYEMMAEILNQWDVVGVQELMPLPSKWAQHNDNLATITRDHNPLQATVVEPGYYRLLKRLRRIDPSWSLILQPKPEGSGPSGEMAGFYYRAKYVQLRDWSYCDETKSYDLKHSIQRKNSACSVRVDARIRNLMSRNGFVANFKAKGFDFVGISFHARFRPLDKTLLPQALNEICMVSTDSNCRKIPADEIGRFIEVKMIADQIPEMQKSAQDPDVIFMGDFNIEILDKNKTQWSAALQSASGYQVFQTENTTLSLTKKSLVSNYDHFIYNPTLTTQCKPETIQIFDFTKPELFLSNPVMKTIESLNDPIIHDQNLNYNLGLLQNVTLSQKIKKSEQTDQNQFETRRMNEKEKLELTLKFLDRSQKMRKTPFFNYYESLSDHIPISMSCSTTK